MQVPIELNRSGALSLQDQLMNRIRELILKAQLAPGARLPSSRDLSEQLAVARNTVMLAYDRLVAEGYLEVRERSGIFVSAHLPERALKLAHLQVPGAPNASSATNRPADHRLMPSRYRGAILYQRPRERVATDFRIGRPAHTSFPEKHWTRLIVQKMAGAGRRMTEYNNPAGLEELRGAICEHLKQARGIVADPDQVVIVGGCQEGLNIVSMMLSPAGSAVYVENPCYKGARYVFESRGARILPVPVDREGICVDGMGREPGVVCVTPSHQFPLGFTMSANRRLSLLQWAAETGSFIVEDDYDSDFRYDGSPLTALAGLDGVKSVIYVGTFSKSLGAGLRLGYLVVPEMLIGPAREAKALLNHGQAWLEQAVLTEFIASGGFEHHLRRIRKLYMRRRDALIDALNAEFGEAAVLGAEGGMHLSWLAPESIASIRGLQNDCLMKGIGIYTMDDGPAIDFDDAPMRDRAVFFGYPCVDEDAIAGAVARIRDSARALAS